MTRGLILSLMALGFTAWWIFIGVYWFVDLFKRLFKQESRREIKNEFVSNTKFIARDRGFHSELRKEFRGTIILVGIVVSALILSALEIGG